MFFKSEQKRNEKAMAEMENYKPVIARLGEKADKCKFGDVETLQRISSVRRALVILPYESSQPRHLSVKPKETVTLLEELPDVCQIFSC